MDGKEYGILNFRLNRNIGWPWPPLFIRTELVATNKEGVYMQEKKKSTMSWILEWAGQKRMDYVWSVILGIGNVIGIEQDSQWMKVYQKLSWNNL